MQSLMGLTQILYGDADPAGQAAARLGPELGGGGAPAADGGCLEATCGCSAGGMPPDPHCYMTHASGTRRMV